MRAGGVQGSRGYRQELYPVILIINYTYAYPEIMMGFGEDTSGRISDIIHYRNGMSEFRLAPGCDLSEKEMRFFARLMGPTRAEWLPSLLGGVAASFFAPGGHCRASR